MNTVRGGKQMKFYGEEFDLYNIPVSYEPNEQMDRKYCGKNADTQKRYQILIQRISDYLKTRE